MARLCGPVAAPMIALFLVIGCNNPPPLPETYPATGIVVNQDGRPLRGVESPPAGYYAAIF